MKTAMQELKDWANKYKGQMISADQVVLKAHNLLIKEKEQCILLAKTLLDNLIEEDINENQS